LEFADRLRDEIWKTADPDGWLRQLSDPTVKIDYSAIIKNQQKVTQHLRGSHFYGLGCISSPGALLGQIQSEATRAAKGRTGAPLPPTVPPNSDALAKRLGVASEIVQEHVSKFPPVKPRRKRPRKAERKPVPLTAGQSEAIHLVGEHKGNISKAAAAAGKSRQAMDKQYKRAMTKIGKTATPKPKTQALPRERRGQAEIADSKAVNTNRDPNVG